jgi:hypothetical protein
LFDLSQKEYQQAIKHLEKNDPELEKIKVEYENKINARPMNLTKKSKE